MKPSAEVFTALFISYGSMRILLSLRCCIYPLSVKIFSFSDCFFLSLIPPRLYKPYPFNAPPLKKHPLREIVTIGYSCQRSRQAAYHSAEQPQRWIKQRSDSVTWLHYCAEESAPAQARPIGQKRRWRRYSFIFVIYLFIYSSLNTFKQLYKRQISVLSVFSHTYEESLIIIFLYCSFSCRYSGFFLQSKDMQWE